MNLSRGVLLLGLLGLLLAGVFAQTQRQTTRPAANARAGAATQPVTRTVPATGAAPGAAGGMGGGMGASAGPAAGGVSTSGGPRNRNNHNEEEEELEFNTEDQRGVFALGGRGSVLIVDNPLTVATGDTVIANIAFVGRFCSDGNGTCAFKLFVNVQGVQTFTIENGPAATSSCTVTFTPGTGEATFTAVGFTVSPSAPVFFDTETSFTGHIVFSDDDFAFFEIDGCGAAGLDTSITPPTPPACDNENFRFVEAAGFARRQDKFCNCSRVSANFEGEDEGECPANERHRNKDHDDRRNGGPGFNF